MLNRTCIYYHTCVSTSAVNLVIVSGDEGFPISKSFLSTQVKSCPQSHSSEQRKLQKSPENTQVGLINAANVFGPRFQTIERTQQQANDLHVKGTLTQVFFFDISFC